MPASVAGKKPFGLGGAREQIVENVLETSTSSYTVSPNLKKQIKGVLQYSSIASSFYGEVYVPEIIFTSTPNYQEFFGDESKTSSFIQEIDIDWHEQNYQKYQVQSLKKTGMDFFIHIFQL